MAIVKPFRGIRPAHDKVHLVASRSYISYKKRDLEAKLNSNPYSFIHIINPEFGGQKTARANSKALFQKIREKFEEFLSDGIFIQENENAFYIYEQYIDGESITGIIGLASTIDYGKGGIKIHEQTLSKREALFCDYLKICDIHAEPVLLSYPDHKGLELLISQTKKDRPLYDFSTTNRVRHKLWAIGQESLIQEVEKSFKEIPELYIADGHHRCASSYLLSQQNQIKENHPYNFFMSLFVPESQLKIFEFNRLIKDLNGMDAREFLEALEEHFEISLKEELFEPSKKGQFSLYLNEQWYSLNCKRITDLLDAQLLNELVLAPLLDIKDLRNDKRVGFIGGKGAALRMKAAVDKNKFTAAFGLYPVDISELKGIADKGEIMPPKSTYIEPKLRSGLTIYSYSK
ncbi:MAG: DUF1015 domain-containing protein [Bacteroidota bacterium]